THGGGGLRDLLVGSIAQQVLHRGTTPVLLTRPDPSGHAPPFAPRTVLVPLDGTAAAEVALAPAQDVARHAGAALHLVMVVATHGRAGVQAIWAGSVTARLLARTRAPVLLLRTIDR